MTPPRATTTAAGADDGVTLVELIIAMVILTIIMGPISAVTVIGYRTWTASTTSLFVSHDRQLLETYFVRDAASATTATVGKAGSCKPAGVTVVQWLAGLQWNGQRQADGTWQHSYESDYATTTVGGKPVLQRWFCADGASTPTSVLTVAHSLSTAAAQPVSATCTPAPSSGTCPTGTVAAPVTITLSITDAAGVSYAVAAEQRAQG